MKAKMIKIAALSVGIAAMVAAACTCASAASVIGLDTSLTCPEYSNTLTASITRLGSMYHYEYVLNFTDTCKDQYGLGAKLTVLSIGNMGNYDFLNVGNDAGLIDPVCHVTSGNSLIWYSPAGIAGPKSIKLWYDSVYSFREVSATMVAGETASGITLGLIPEPGTLVSLGLGLIGLGATFLRRR